eukprot:93495-Amorphochlora_amoeboformis.AAC.1
MAVPSRPSHYTRSGRHTAHVLSLGMTGLQLVNCIEFLSPSTLKMSRESKDRTVPRSMIGRVLSTTRPEWQPDVSHLSVSIFTRASGARRYGIRGMCGVYCRTRQGLQFVIGLFSGNRVTFTKERKKAILKMVEVWAQGSVPGPEKPIKIISRGDSFIVPEATGSPVFATNVSLNKWVDMQ